MRLRELREERNLTQQEVAESIGGTQSNLAKWEKGKIQPSADAIVRLAAFFGVSTDYLLGQTDDLGNVQTTPHAPLSNEEEELLGVFSRMSHAQKIRFLAYGEGMLGADVPIFTRK